MGRHGTSGKYRNLTQIRRPVSKPSSDDLGLLDEGPHWRFREDFSILDYCTYHVLIAFIVLIVVVTTVTLAIVLSPKQEALRTQPNILVIIADDLGYNDVGYRGSGNIRTPYIDRLARSSIQLERHYTLPMCTPTRAALFTGRYPFRYGMGGSRAIYYGSRNGLPLSEHLLPQVMKSAKYNTYLIGKWHLGFADWAMTPTRRGFDYFYGTYGGSTTYKTHQSYEGPREGKGYDLFEDSANYEERTGVNHTVVEDPNETFSELLFTDKAVELLEKSAKDVEKDPFFMVVSYQNPHAPIEPMQEDVEQNKHIKNQKRRMMGAMITSLDYGVGRITTALENTHQLNKTVIIFLSDNGGHLMMPSGESLGSSNLPLRGAKCTLYEGGIRTPAFIRIPHYMSGTRNSSVKYHGLFHVSDWFPTIAKLAQIDPQSTGGQLELDGFDHTETFRELLSDNPKKGEAAAEPRDHVVLDIDPVFNQAGIIQGDFKLLVGNPAILNFSAVYPLITEDSIKDDALVADESSYVLPNMRQQMLQYASLQTDYANNSTHCLSLECMSKDLTLYDLSVDITESFDISWRFRAIKEQLYDTLMMYANDTRPLAEPQFFEDHNSEALASGKVWTPWILNSTEV